MEKIFTGTPSARHNPKSVLNQRAGLLRAHVRLRRYAKRLGAARKIRLTTYICSRAQKEAHMLTSRARQELPALSIGSSIGTVLGLPPKDPDNDDDEDEEDDEDASFRRIVRSERIIK